ncbi:MAG: hypothetical protein Q8K75_07110 [Chlamydiales bacterium]|nr:hypothetical protein [Chlamydiales bacterium]
MDYRFHNRDKVKVSIIGVETEVGKRLKVLFNDHTMFQVSDEEPNVTIDASEMPFIQIGAGKNSVVLQPEINGEKLLPSADGFKVRHLSAPSTLLALALYPLQKTFGITHARAVTLLPVEDLSIPSMDLLDNALLASDSISVELQDLLGLQVSSQSFRVNMSAGMLQLVSVGFPGKPKAEEIIECWKAFSAIPHMHGLPSAAQHPLQYFAEEGFPQPKRHRNLDSGKVVAIGSLKESQLYDYEFAIVSNPSVRGPIGGTLLNAEFLVKTGFIFW